MPAGARALLVAPGGELLETTRANVFVVRDGVLRTPPLDGRILPGITRAVVLERRASGRVPRARGAAHARRSADAILLTGSVRLLECAGVLRRGRAAREDDRGYITQSAGRLSEVWKAAGAVDLLDHDLFADHEPWEVFEALQRDAPVYFHPEPDGGRGFWVLTKFDDVRAVLKDYRPSPRRSAGRRGSRTCRRTCSPRGATSSSSTRPSTVATAGSSPPTSRRPPWPATRTGCARSCARAWTRRCRKRRVRPRRGARGADPDPRARAHPRPARGAAAAADRARRPPARRHRARLRRGARLPRRARRVPLQAVRLAVGGGAVRARPRAVRGASRLPARRRPLARSPTAPSRAARWTRPSSTTCSR